MPTNLTLMSEDKGIHGLDMQTDYDKFICVDNAQRKLVLSSRKDMYMANGLNRNLFRQNVSQWPLRTWISKSCATWAGVCAISPA